MLDFAVSQASWLNGSYKSFLKINTVQALAFYFGFGR